MNGGVMGFPSGLGGDIPIAFLAKHTGGSYTTATQKWAFAETIYDPYGVYDPALSRFNVPVSGVYFLFYNAAQNSAPGKYSQFYLNGSGMLIPNNAGFFYHAGGGDTIHGSAVYYLQAGDYIEVWAGGDGNYSMIGWGNFGGYMIR